MLEEAKPPFRPPLGDAQEALPPALPHSPCGVSPAKRGEGIESVGKINPLVKEFA